MATSADYDVDSGDEFEDALEVLPTTNGTSKPMPVANPDAFEFLLPMIFEKSSPKSFRKKLPYSQDRSAISVWAFLKNLVGKDVTKISMPVHFNEPLSFLQRLSEDIEYVNLCHKAAEATTVPEKLSYLAALASSNYVCTLTRYSKPFNPLLGETYELVRHDLGYCLIAEQVSHHPPITALHCESDKWVFWAEHKLDIKFRGQWARIQPTGLLHFKTKSDGFHYTFNKPHTTIHNIILGQLWADHEGDVIVTSHQTGDKAIVHWNSYSKVKDSYKELKGEVVDKDGKLIYQLKGSWDKRMDRFNADGSNWTNLWKAHDPLPGNEREYGFTEYAMSLNEQDDSIKCPTDARKRPDQRLLEEGRMEEAADEKVRLEEKQRAARKLREKLKGEWQPLWFDMKYDADTNSTYHMFNGKYWNAKLNDDFSICPDIF